MAEENWSVTIPGVEHAENFYVGNPVPYSIRDNNWTSRYAHKHRVGNWDRKRPVVLDLTPYDLLNEVVRYPQGYLTASNGIGRSVRSGVFNVPSPYPNGFTPVDHSLSLRDQAIIDALQRLKDQKFNTGVAVAEASGLADMAGDIFSAVARARKGLSVGELQKTYERFRKDFSVEKSFKQFKDEWGSHLSREERLSKVPKSWLYYQFGIAPTLSDLNSVHEDWARRHAVPGRNTHKGVVRGSAKNSERMSGPNGNYWPQAELLELEHVQSVRVYLHVQLKDEFHARLAQMGVTNLPEAGWNGMPFSWLVDYAINIGDYLSILDAGLGYEFSRTVESYREITRSKCSRWTVHPQAMNPPPSVERRELSEYRYRRTALKRKIVEELYPPMSRVIPRLRLNKPSMKKFANALSVLCGLGGRRPPRI